MTKKDVQTVINILQWEGRIGDLERKLDKHDVVLGMDKEDDEQMENRIQALETKIQKQSMMIRLIVSVFTLILSGLVTLIASGHIGPILKYFMGM